MDIPINSSEPDITVRCNDVTSFEVVIYNICVMNKEDAHVTELAEKHNAIDLKLQIVPSLSMISFATKEDSDAFVNEFV